MQTYQNDLIQQLREYGLCPNEWRWKTMNTDTNEGLLENKMQSELFLIGQWKKESSLPNQSPQLKWNYLEWQI